MDAIGDAAAMIRSGEAEFAIAGGTDAPITPIIMASFIAGGLTSLRNEEPERASRPFDLGRDSGVVSEGAGVLVLENFERAAARGARAYVELGGYGKQRDLNPELPGSGLEYSMKLALANAGCTEQNIDYISAYGPGHPVLDAAEVQIIKKVFGERAYAIPVSSIKGVTGNAMAAGGPFQIIACALSIRDHRIPPTANYEVADPTCDLDFVPNRSRKVRLNSTLVNVRGLGGGASTMVLNRIAA
jgi:3-oxoacyl-[acyl-carrier-protein] synthase II